LHVRLKEVLVSAPKVEASRDVENAVASGHRRRDSIPVRQVTAMELDAQVAKIRVVASTEDANPLAALDERSYDPATDEAAASGYE
jgi:hypothetical protein